MILGHESGATIKSLSKKVLGKESESRAQSESESASQGGFVFIVDTLGKLRSAKWRLMSDKIPFKYLQQIPSEKEINEWPPSVILLHLSSFQRILDITEDGRNLVKKHSFVVVGKKEEEEGLKLAFNRGAKAVFTLPLDLPKLSSLCKNQIEKNRRAVGSASNIVTSAIRIKNPAPGLQQGSKIKTLFTVDKIVLNSLPLGILYVSLDGNILLANKSFRNIMDVNDRELRGHSYLELCPGDANQLQLTLKKLLGESLLECKPVQDMKVVLPGKSNQPVPGLLNIETVVNESGEVTGLLITLVEQKMTKEGQDSRFRSEKLAVAGQLAAGAVHEIKSPLTSVRGFIQLLQYELQDSPKAEYIDIIISEIDRVNNIVNEFLKLAKPSDPKRSDCSLTELFEEIRVLMESEAFLKNVIIEEKYSQLPPVKIDKEQIKQVLVNIIQNAFEAMSGGGRLIIKAQPMEIEKKIMIQFTDTGCGISEEVKSRIFEPFFTTKEQGTGLGLAVSQQIMESHGGHMEIISERAQGTTTTLYLPY